MEPLLSTALYYSAVNEKALLVSTQRVFPSCALAWQHSQYSSDRAATHMTACTLQLSFLVTSYRSGNMFVCNKVDNIFLVYVA